MKVLQDIWILTNSGTTLYSKVFNPKINEQLFGALMSALNQFAERVTEGGITSFELSDKRFTIIKKKDFLFIANSSVKKEKKAMEELKDISDKFFEIYSSKLDDWDGDVNTFADFGDYIEDSPDKSVKKFKEAFW